MPYCLRSAAPLVLFPHVLPSQSFGARVPRGLSWKLSPSLCDICLSASNSAPSGRLCLYFSSCLHVS